MTIRRGRRARKKVPVAWRVLVASVVLMLTGALVFFWPWISELLFGYSLDYGCWIVFVIGPIVFFLGICTFIVAIVQFAIKPRSTYNYEGRCPTCGYMLLGLTDTRCPECGCRFEVVSRRQRVVRSIDGQKPPTAD